mmetsp:Transcript_1578/g.4600  ORF Transcript_1578/g.4600 Transcript_1578/m.4600 type:complete len:257 (+) Transcript_1578:1166-1936(+)
MAVKRLIIRSAFSRMSISPRDARHAGMLMPRMLMSRRVVLADAAVALNFCIGLVMPPATHEQPSTRRVLDMIEPRSDTCTTESRPLARAKRLTMSSVAFPNVAFRRPPTVSLVCRATCSVASPRSFARGRMARQLKPKTLPALQDVRCAVMPMGRKTRSQLRWELNSIFCEPTQNRGTSASGSFATLLTTLERPRRRKRTSESLISVCKPGERCSPKVTLAEFGRCEELSSYTSLLMSSAVPGSEAPGSDGMREAR